MIQHKRLCLLESLILCNGFDLKDFSDNLLSWYNDGLWAVDNIVFDCGIQTSRALNAYKGGLEAEKCGFVLPEGKGNGALMRVLPLALWSNGNSEQLISNAHEQCLITHGHICNQVCAALYCLWARNLLDNIEIKKSYNLAVSELKDYYEARNFNEYSYELEIIIQDEKFSGSGYVVDSMRSVKTFALYIYNI